MNFKQANIIITTLFITLIIGLIGLLITKYVYNSVKISSENYKYYKAYYISYAGVELELLKNKLHGYGFEDVISGNSQTVSKNFTGNKYFFSVRTLSLSKNITANPLSLLFPNINCSDKKNWIFLNTGDAILLPLFYDKNTAEAKLSGINYKLLNLDLSNITLHYNGNFTISLQQADTIVKKSNVNGNDDSKNINEILGINSLLATVDDKPFLVIGALQKGSFCISSSDKLVDIYSYILSKGNFMDRAVLLNVAKKHQWANFTVYSIFGQ